VVFDVSDGGNESVAVSLQASHKNECVVIQAISGIDPLQSLCWRRANDCDVAHLWRMLKSLARLLVVHSRQAAMGRTWALQNGRGQMAR
jgi:hypothetical protein